MIVFPENILMELGDIYIVSNSPYYLIGKFQKFHFIQGLSENYTTEELAAYFFDLVNEGNELLTREKNLSGRLLDTNKNNQFKIMLKKYSVLISITLKEPSEARATLENIDDSSLEWWKKIKEAYLITCSPIIHVSEGGNYEFSKKLSESQIINSTIDSSEGEDRATNINISNF